MNWLTSSVGARASRVRKINWRVWPRRCGKTSALVGSKAGASISCELATHGRFLGVFCQTAGCHQGASPQMLPAVAGQPVSPELALQADSRPRRSVCRSRRPRMAGLGLVGGRHNLLVLDRVTRGIRHTDSLNRVHATAAHSWRACRRRGVGRGEAVLGRSGRCGPAAFYRRSA